MKTAVVMGLGVSGRAALGLLGRAGFPHRIGVDRNPVDPIPGVELQCGPHRRETFIQADLVVVSPGIPLSAPVLLAAREAGVEILGEVGLADRYALDDSVPRVAITGTNGKSTTTHLTGQLLEATGFRPFVGGNLGHAVSNADVGDPGAYVLELSSYQLESAGAFRADVGMILNLTPDHLTRHGDMEGYADAKNRLFRCARGTDLCVLPAADPWLTDARAGTRGTRAWLGGAPGVRREDRWVSVELEGRSARFSLDGLTLPGQHNLDNTAAALFAAWALGADASRLQDAVAELSGLPHRMAVVSEGPVRWIDDSKSTNVDSTVAALRGGTRPTVLLLGGESKGPGFTALKPHLGHVHTVICFGADGPSIAAELEAAECVVTMRDALERAASVARPGDDVLLSPGCASFDEFTDFAHRGRVFGQWVKDARE